jgi:hypothetical protein
MKRSRRIIMLCIAANVSQVLEPEYNDDIVKALEAKDKVIADIKSIERNMFVQSPKEYGIKKLGKYDNRKYQKRK